MNVETLLAVLEKVPGDYEVKFQDKIIKGTLEIDTENKKIILK